ncbi:MAG: hypothetical protein JW870_17275 [Candidatus Delongbacteria bacterium]|nr:hypothetical protein [Candidatus Delongbacteria bacterium]
MSVFRYCIRKFLEILVYCENAVSNKCSVVFAIVQSSLIEFLKFGAGRLFMLLTELSVWDVWQNSFVEKSEKYCSCEVVELF